MSPMDRHTFKASEDFLNAEGGDFGNQGERVIRLNRDLV